MEPNTNNIIIYQSEDGTTHIEVKLEENTVWLTQQQMADLYQTSRSNIAEHLLHIYEEGELIENATCRKFRQVRLEEVLAMNRLCKKRRQSIGSFRYVPYHR